MCLGERGLGERNSIMGEKTNKKKNIQPKFNNVFFFIMSAAIEGFQLKIGQDMIVIKSSIIYGGTVIKSQQIKHIPPQGIQNINGFVFREGLLQSEHIINFRLFKWKLNQKSTMTNIKRDLVIRNLHFGKQAGERFSKYS